MRKRIVATARQVAEPSLDKWLDLEAIAEVEVTSEEADHPVEFALLPGQASGWCAAEPGEQTIRLLFAHPQPLRRIWLHFEDARAERVQEYVLRWSGDGGKTYRDIVRQQWNFSPRGSIAQTEDHRVELPAVTALELSIVPDKSGGSARACLEAMRLA